MRIAILLIRQGAITYVSSRREDKLFGQASRQLEIFQEEVKEITDALQEAQGKHRSTNSRKLCWKKVTSYSTSIVTGN